MTSVTGPETHCTELQCPECRTLLRIREPEFVREGFDCPECDAAIPPLEVAASEPEPDSTSAGTAFDADSILSAAPAAPSPDTLPPGPSSRLDELDAVPKEPVVDLPARPPKQHPKWLPSPVVIAWSTAIVGVIAVAFVLFRPDPEPNEIADGQQDEPGTEQSDTPPEEPPKDTPADQARERFAGLGRRLVAYRARHEELPSDATGDLQGGDTPLSWIARLEAFDSLGGVAPPNWNHPYDDLRNADFVRRERPEFLNPLIGETRSEAREPVTHFVGVGGVGEDAPLLAADHPRAGMFGAGRAARLNDVTDGLANTMMIAGVRADLGSWAAAGRGTVRPFTAEPYVNGPDGFGTGSADGMFVLMGDGSVRTIGVATDPRIVRRMAAANDGLDLELEVPGEPGDASNLPDVPVVARVDPPPPEVEPAPDPMPAEPGPPEPVDPEDPLLPLLPKLPEWNEELVALKLAQPLAGFRTKRPVSAELLLDEVAEMCGVPIHARKEEGIDLDVFERPISLTVEKGTVGTVLDALLAKLELRYVVANDGLHLEPVSTNPGPPSSEEP